MSKHEWHKFKAGERAWSIARGRWVTLHSAGGSYVSDGLLFYTAEGVLFGFENRLPILFRNEVKPEDWPQPEPPLPPLPDLPVDAPIMVRQTGRWIKRHFARWENGEAVCWINGLTSFTTAGASKWEEWRLPTAEELTCPNE